MGYGAGDRLADDAKGRPVMGRKGIGKLSLFAIADVVRVESSKDGARAGLVLETPRRSEKQMSREETACYNPTPLDPEEIDVAVGTRITLTAAPAPAHRRTRQASGAAWPVASASSARRTTSR